MKKYNIKNYIRYKEDVKISIAKIPIKDFVDYSNKELKIIFLPLVENVARKFSTAQEASGVMSIMDLIQEGSFQLNKAVDKLDRERLIESEDVSQTLKSFFAKRIRGGIRREVDKNRGQMRIPEHKLNEIRRDNGKDKKMVAMFFNSMFLSIDNKPYDDDDMVYQIPDTSEPYNMGLLNMYLISLLKKHLDYKEYEVLRMSYGLDCDKHSAKEIAVKLEIKGASDYVRVSELKKQAVTKLIDNVDHSQVLDYL
ncbi:MAG: sigma-70 family RNA polymerase sigma factor [Candidatus Brocadiaceae bacterium]|jgi:RNA polymerase sigma factor (sigma-70 family)|nr:sigma-70 family RNA polymerase sigma factor [Candidatus Brocadiaceae bacterium]